QRLLPIRHNRRGPAVAVSDLNGDGRDDICFGGTTLDAARLAVLAPPGKFLVQSLEGSPGPTNDGPVLIFDINGDGRDDVLLTRGGAGLWDGSAEYQPQIYLNLNGGLERTPQTRLPPLRFSVGAAVAADWDRNGTLDVFLGGRLLPGEYPLAPASALLSNEHGQFIDVTGSVAPELDHVGMVTGALWTDVDGDGWVDLLVAVEWSGIRYFHNDRGQRLEDWSRRAGFEAAGTGWWSAIAAADFNGDGRMDYAVGNVGQNTPYQADSQHPALLFYGDFGGSEGAQIIEARHDGNRIVPWRSRKELGAVLPSILKVFPKNDMFARQSLDAILGADKIAAARRFAATEFRSGIFLSQPDGSFRFEALPRLAQIAPIYGLVAGDFDGDGFADLCAAQNSYAPVPSIGRFGGGIGQFIRGDGKGGFLAAPPAESGFLVSGDGKGLAVADLDQDGWPDFIVTRNNAANLVFKNRGVAGRHSFGVVLQGGPGNPRAVGARITVELADGNRRVGEVQAGGGHMSQSTATCHFGYADNNPPRRVTIRWPDGRTTTESIEDRALPAVLTFKSEAK
ncbi:MAG TPA: CRTAC1 family protein, partial [Bacteroidia bacterium]|nr:CRTAC1 family protein [Bacteroidia bacterium]